MQTIKRNAIFGGRNLRQVIGIITPKGLKIRLDEEFCSQILKENVSIDSVLEDVEDFVMSPKWLLFIAGLIGFYMRLPEMQLAVISFAIITIMAFTSWIHPLYSLTRNLITSIQPRVFVQISGWYIDKLILLLVGYSTFPAEISK